MPGWLTDFTEWLADAGREALAYLTAWLEDVGVTSVDAVLSAAVAGLQAIPIPGFLTSNSIGGFLSLAGPNVGWVVGELRVGECLAMIGAALVFRVARKVMTLGFW